MSGARSVTTALALNRFQFEKEARSAGFINIAGCDEAGRGPLAGPVVAAAVILPCDPPAFAHIVDSKMLSPETRSAYYDFLQNTAHAIGVGIVHQEMIDSINILQATFLAMQQACLNLPLSVDYVLIDGNRRPSWLVSGRTIVRGETHSASIAAASIIAKVTRDRMMDQYDQQFPQWGFARHKGYGTAEHVQAIHNHGICALHRRTFAPVKTLLQQGLIPWAASNSKKAN